MNQSMEILLLVESVDRLSRLSQIDFEVLKGRIKEKGLKLVVADLPTTHMLISSNDIITSSILNLVNNMLIDLLATMARLDNDKRRERIKQGLERSGYKPSGKKADIAKHFRIKELADKGLTKEEIAKAVNCGVATIYRVLKMKNKESFIVTLIVIYLAFSFSHWYSCICFDNIFQIRDYISY